MLHVVGELLLAVVVGVVGLFAVIAIWGAGACVSNTLSKNKGEEGWHELWFVMMWYWIPLWAYGKCKGLVVARRNRIKMKKLLKWEQYDSLCQ